ncbi:SHOCT domain-containing protein [Urbifossiella limnaea]|uniref:SHOCT domain-containing protein n=1 Tax=Urbifossiella limnaea TaxID=2528023 RepID=A0A517XL20_9BACT|nr:SHOCT domain-containing protein [Urbifossiella limnaea]QDU18207.1 hypothetical protein ETAA1_00900 [Urbifossiella limnaea]
MSSSLLSLFAQAGGKPPGTPWEKPELLYASLAIAAALLAGGVVIYFVDRWRKSGLAPGTADGAAELTGFRGMLERGEITEEEYARLRQKAAARLKGPASAVETKSPAALDTAPAPPAPPNPTLPGPLPDDYFDDPQPPPRPT